MVRPEAQKLCSKFLVERFSVSARRTSRVLGLNRSTLTYNAKPSRDGPLAARMKQLAAKHRRFGLPRLHFLLHREGYVRARSRTARVYALLGLQLKKRRRKKLVPVVRVPFVKAVKPYEIWSFDFVHDYVQTDRRLKCLTIVDDCSKRNPGLLAEYSITSKKMTDFFDSLPRLPKKFRCDNGPEMTSREFMDWADRRGIEIEYIEPGKPIQNAYVESFNSRFRDECLNEEIFLDLEDAKKKIEKWRRSYNYQRPHSALGMKTPIQFEEGFKNKN